MGLAMAYGIVRSHGGWIDLETTVGQGTTFKIFVPCAKPDVVAEEVTADEEPLHGHGRILVVDDEEIVRGVLKMLLGAWGYEVFCVENGEDAVAYYRKHKGDVDLVIVDMIMPVMNGWSCFTALKAIDPDVKVIIATGYGVQDLSDKFRDEGALGFVEKPFEADKLARAVFMGVKGQRLN